MKQLSGNLNFDIQIKKLYSVNYFEFSKDYKISNKVSDCWKLVYVDNGELVYETAGDKINLAKEKAIIQKPGEPYSVCTNGSAPAYIVVIAFDFVADNINFFENMIINITAKQKRLISKILMEFSATFENSLEKPYINALQERIDRPVGSKQLIYQYLCELLIFCMRGITVGHMVYDRDSKIPTNSVIEFMTKNISHNITVEDMAHHYGTGVITVNRMFRKYHNTTPMQYFIKLKIDYAKKYLRETDYNVTQIAEMLGYANIHYFSSQFKKITGMSPTQYLESIQAVTDSFENLF